MNYNYINDYVCRVAIMVTQIYVPKSMCADNTAYIAIIHFVSPLYSSVRCKNDHKIIFM